MINPIARQLNIPVPHNVRAQTILFKEDGSYKDFDTNEPTSRSGGKARALADIRERGNYQTVVMIGDGATDLEAQMPGIGADLMVGFGGVIVRDVVLQKADWFVYSHDELIKELDNKYT